MTINNKLCSNDFIIIKELCDMIKEDETDDDLEYYHKKYQRAGRCPIKMMDHTLSCVLTAFTEIQEYIIEST